MDPAALQNRVVERAVVPGGEIQAESGWYTVLEQQVASNSSSIASHTAENALLRFEIKMLRQEMEKLRAQVDQMAQAAPSAAPA